MSLIFAILFLILGIPIGLIISRNARDELVAGRKWFGVLALLGFAGGVWFLLIGEIVVSLTFWFILIVSATSLVKSHDPRWIKKRRV